MPATDPALPGAGAPGAAVLAAMKRDDGAIAFSGRLDQTAAIRLWPELAAVGPQPGQGNAVPERIVLDGLTYVDSAGLALLVHVANRLRAAGARPRIEGTPPGLSDLRAAYRLGPELEFPG